MVAELGKASERKAQGKIAIDYYYHCPISHMVAQEKKG